MVSPQQYSRSQTRLLFSVPQAYTHSLRYLSLSSNGASSLSLYSFDRFLGRVGLHTNYSSFVLSPFPSFGEFYSLFCRLVRGTPVVPSSFTSHNCLRRLSSLPLSPDSLRTTRRDPTPAHWNNLCHSHVTTLVFGLIHLNCRV